MRSFLKTTFIAASVALVGLCSTNVIAGERYVYTTSSASSATHASIQAANAAPRPLKALPSCIYFQAGFGWLCVGEFAD
jgi:hypothetical protein